MAPRRVSSVEKVIVIPKLVGKHDLAPQPAKQPAPQLPKPVTWCPSNVFDKEMHKRAQEIESLRAQLAAADEAHALLTTQSQEQANEFQRAKLTHEAGLKSMLTATEQWHAETDAKHKAALEAAEEERLSQLAAVEKRHAAELKTTLDEIQASLVGGPPPQSGAPPSAKGRWQNAAKAAAATKSKNERLEATVKSLQRDLEEAGRAHRAQIAALKTEHQSTHAALVAKHRGEMEVAEQDHLEHLDATISELRGEFVKAMTASGSEAEMAHQAAKMELNAKHEAEVEDLKQTHEDALVAALAAAAEKHAEHMLRERKRHLSKMTSSEAEAEAQLQTWVETARGLQKEVAQLNDEVARLNALLPANEEAVRVALQQKVLVENMVVEEGKAKRQVEEQILVIKEMAAAEMQAAADAQVKAAAEVRAKTAEAQMEIAKEKAAADAAVNAAQVRTLIAEMTAKRVKEEATLTLAREDALLNTASTARSSKSLSQAIHAFGTSRARKKEPEVVEPEAGPALDKLLAHGDPNAKPPPPPGAGTT